MTRAAGYWVALGIALAAPSSLVITMIIHSRIPAWFW